MVQPVKNPINTVLRAGFANPLPLDIKVIDASYVKVYVDELEIDPDTYTVSGVGSDDGVEITIAGVGPDWYPNAVVVTAAFEPPVNQPADLSAGGIFGIAYENVADNIVRIILSLKGGLDRTLKVPYGVEGNIVLPSPVPGASIAWDDFGTGFINGPSTADISIITPYLPAISGVYADIDAVIVAAASIDIIDTVAASIGSVNAVAASLPNISVIISFQSELQTVVDNIAPILFNAANIDAIIAAKDEADRAEWEADRAEQIATDALNDLRGIIAEPGAVPPATPALSQVWYRTTDGQAVIWDGSAWAPLASTSIGGVRVGHGTFSAPLDKAITVGGGFQEIYVWLNGLLQAPGDISIAGSVVTVTNAAVGDEWSYWGYEALDATDYYSKAEVDNLLATIDLDPWAMQPFGVPIAVMDDLDATLQPPTNKAYRYVLLTASDAYNTGVLTGETISGTAPNLTATAVVSLAGSPLNGKTIPLINTDRRFLRAGSAGTKEQSQNLSHDHTGTAASAGAHIHSGAFTLKSQGPVPGAGGPTLPGYSSDNTGSAGAHTHPLTIDASGGNEARPANIGATYYMRIK